MHLDGRVYFIMVSYPIPTVYTLECHEPGLLWWDFAQQVGPEELKASFRWDTPPPAARAHEYVWRVFDVEHQRWHVGWFSIRHHPCDMTIGYLIRGVFPDSRRKGYRVAIGEVAAKQAVMMGVKYLIIEIAETNVEHLRRHSREFSDGGPWIYSGCVWHPEPKTHLFTRLLGQ